MKRAFMPSSCWVQKGFSLLEVLVAFSIMALALGVLYQAVGNSVRNTQRVEIEARAAVLARSLLALHTEVPPEGVSVSGTSPDGLAWSVHSSAFDPASLIEGAPARPLHRVEISIRRDGAQAPFSLVTLVPEVRRR